MITLQLNGENKELRVGSSIVDAINEWQLEQQSFAIALNEEFVPKSSYSSIALQDGDRLEVLIPMQGG